MATDDKKRSLQEWGALSSQVLKLKCNQYNLISTGNKLTLRKRLFEFLNPPAENQPPESSHTGNDTVMADILQELQSLRNEVADIRDKQTTKQTSPPFQFPTMESPLFSESVPVNSNIRMLAQVHTKHRSESNDSSQGKQCDEQHKHTRYELIIFSQP